MPVHTQNNNNNKYNNKINKIKMKFYFNAHEMPQ